jgi:hypothetical protein
MNQSEPPPVPGDSPETATQRRARVLAEIERSLAEGLPAAPDTGWQYPPVPVKDVPPPPEPPFPLVAVILLGTVVAVVVVIVLAVVASP